MKRSLFLSLLLLSVSISVGAETPQSALKKLTDGNQRFIDGHSTCPDRSSERRLSLVSTQSPFAVIVGCSDSRVAPEIIFDQGIGNLFIVRVAGNVVGPIELDSIDYAAIHLKSSVIVVLGHENCGAVKAVLAGTTKDIPAVAELIRPAVEKTKGDQPATRAEKAIKDNVRNVAAYLRNTPAISGLIKENSIQVVEAYFNLQTGKVELL